MFILFFFFYYFNFVVQVISLHKRNKDFFFLFWVGFVGPPTYWLNDLHVSHGLVGCHCGPVRQLLVSGGFAVEAVRERAQLETISI